MARQWVINASPIITLAKVSQISLFEEMCTRVVVPEGVVREIEQGTIDDPARTWIRGKGGAFIRESERISPLVVAWDLGKGETHVISWAYLNPSYEAIVDDRAARRCARSLGVRVREERWESFS